MDIWLLKLLSPSILRILAPLALILIGFLVEKHYTGRITMFANAIALVTFFMMFDQIPKWAIIYTNLVTALGVVGILSYALKWRLFEAYYTFGKLASSVVTGLIILTFSFT
ncbi:hypothetical protein HN695_02335 [Candidatus Woesearchaeota archaeon]|jgi:hypothetical protein|nr:hypothetical protein [Candidatus Woesearchaeota archaeon]MBT5272923.1 hypothetical protein [Candidatus Woesearchaeota archaeon]MBT6041389.1 hypothetical protein [Candidatus Woesearchaeota archaeon]MBT6337272.1 hypothetical protein [Candidatus Woesearchaeota archaeon]MBT7927149.1 hypothetical protein [Candidatus Woesearchaeota archaeon]